MPIIQEDPFRKYNPQKFSFEQVKGDVSEAMQFDWKRDKVDDAKKRAIYDARSYDEFKQRVAGCTLKPIHKNDFMAPPKHAFNRGGKAPAPASDILRATHASCKPDEVPGCALAAPAARPEGGETWKNAREFDRDFRRCTTASEKVSLAMQLTDSAYRRIFARELDAELFRKLLEAFDGTSSGGGRHFLVSLVTNCGTATAQAAPFLSAAERAIMARLLAREAPADAKDDVRVCATLGITVSSVAAAKEAIAQEAPVPAAREADPVPVVEAREADPVPVVEGEARERTSGDDGIGSGVGEALPPIDATEGESATARAGEAPGDDAATSCADVLEEARTPTTVQHSGVPLDVAGPECFGEMD